jgi:hypothetical protein
VGHDRGANVQRDVADFCTLLDARGPDLIEDWFLINFGPLGRFAE